MPGSPDSYLQALPANLQERGHAMRALITKCAPHIEEGMFLGRPSYFYDGLLFSFAVKQDHTAFYINSQIRARFQNDLAAFPGNQDAIHFPHTRKLPAWLINSMIRQSIALKIKSFKR